MSETGTMPIPEKSPVSINQTLRTRPSDALILAIVLTVGLVNGLLFTFLMPPWQHHDEPNHFEALALMVRLGRMFKLGDYDEQLSKDVTQSMVAYRFYGDHPAPDFAAYGKTYIPGYTQLEEPPVYYWAASIPLRLMRNADIVSQLRAGRLVSLIFYLMALLCAWGVTRELTRPGSPLRWMVPLSIALLPTFTDVMTALNNDSAAVAVMSLFLWGAVRLIRRGINLVDLLWVIVAAGVGFYTKSTAYFALILLPVAILFAVLRDRLRWLSWVLLALGFIVVLLASLQWGDPAWWARSNFQEQPMRIESPSAPLGDHVFRLDLKPGINPNSNEARFLQAHQILVASPRAMREKYLTVGAWMWASRPVIANLPVFRTFDGKKTASKDVWLTETPTFYAYKTRVEGGAGRNWITLAPLVETLDGPVSVYFDGLVVAEGRYATDQPPAFADADGTSGTWGGKDFTNLLRNGSAESAWLRLRPKLDELGMRVLPDYSFNIPSISLYYLLDLKATWRSHYIIIKTLFESFWGRFGWAHVTLLHTWVYKLMAAVTLAGLLGGLVGLWRRRRFVQWEMVGFLGLAVLGPWILAVARTATYAVIMGPLYFPTARYTFPVIIPMMLMLNLGWYEIGRLLLRWLPLPSAVWKWAYVVGLVAFDLYAVVSIAKFYSIL